MNRLFKQFSTNSRRPDSIRPFLCLATAIAFLCFPSVGWSQVKQGRDAIRLSVVAVNPSATKTQKVPVKTVLPTEVTPDDIVNAGGLTVEFDTSTSTYYLYSEGIELKPKEVREFQVELRDAWVIHKDRIDALRDQAASMIEHMKGTPDYEMGQKLGEAINKALDTIEQTQNDETVSTQRHIGIYRSNLKIIDQVKEDISRLEKQASLSAAAAGGSAGASASVAAAAGAADSLHNSKVQTDSPDKSTTWMIIFIIMAFMGLLAGGFFITWYAQGHLANKGLSDAKNSAFPKPSEASSKGAKGDTK